MRKFLIFLLLIFFSNLHAQKPEKLNSSEIFQKIQKLNFLGSVLYVGAHPDDENTRLISYLSNGVNARTAYLSLTRGDGGQNLLGPQLRELLGIIRTQELLAARKVDGGIQFFTRANDFGYSKNPKETLKIWDRKEVLADVVWVIRNFKPDIIINRFNANSAGETHGHHTASAILSKKAFKIADDPSAFPAQLEKTNTWQPKKLFFNTSSWFYESREAFEKAAKDDFLKFDTGVYFPLMGLSNTEIASLSRSKHKSQGFGSSGSRGSQLEYLEPVFGENRTQNDSLFSCINTTWSRIEGGKAIGKILYSVQENYNFKNPAASVPKLVKAYKLIQNLENEHWKRIKSEAIKEIIAAASGLYLEAVSETPLNTPGEKIGLTLEAINRSPVEMQLQNISVKPAQKSIFTQIPLKNNIGWEKEIHFQIPEDISFTTPYWLQEKGSLGMYKVANQELIGLPLTPNQIEVVFSVKINGTTISFSREIVYKTTDPVKGEVYKPFEIVPKISVSLEDKVIIFSENNSKIIPVTVRSIKGDLQGTLTLEHSPGWKVSPSSYQFNLSNAGMEKTFLFTVTPPETEDESILLAKATVNGELFTKEIVQIDYDHIPLQTVLLPAEAKTVKLNIKKEGELIGFIPGAGGAVPQALEQIGYKVSILEPEKITAENLKKFDAVVTGVRAYNVVDALAYKQDELLEYVKNGGNLIVQYNTNRGLEVENLAPYELELSRDRVTDEHAEVKFLEPNHSVLNTPNKITQTDFEGWVQERGLYFPDEWAEEFTPIFSMHDLGESPKKGSLLIAPY
ncbi:MAG TPA: PIG-L family deacetylase, partial [Salinimicrobium sp.]|nr:PIG-L family deacetylase [Salinimicrobium sp.]